MAVSLFDDIIRENKNTLSTEMIKNQYNDLKIIEVEKIINRLKEKYHAHVLGYDDFQKDAEIDIENIIKERFGIHVRLIHDSIYPYCIPLPPLNRGAFMDGEEQYKNLENAVDQLEDERNSGYHAPSDDKNRTSKKEEEYGLNRWIRLIKGSLEDMEHLDRVLNTRGVKINNDKAHIDGLPAGYRPLINCDIKWMLQQDFTPAEITAVIYHELGHIYSAVERQYRTYKEAIAMEDRLADLSRKSNEPIKTMLLAYEEVYKDKNLAKECKDKDITTVTIKVVGKIIGKYERDMHNDSSVDVENYADMFSARCGYAVPLATALNKLHEKNISGIFLPPKYLGASSVYRVLVSIWRFIAGVLVASSVAYLYIGYVLATIVYMFYRSITRIFLSNTTFDLLTYDEGRDRFRKVKQQYILRISKLKDPSPELSKSIDNDIKMLDRCISYANEYDAMVISAGLADATASIFSSEFRNKRERVNLTHVLEELSHSKLYIAANKLNTLKGR